MLTKEEQTLAANAQVLLTKNKIIAEVYELFGRLATYTISQVGQFPATALVAHAKISKGENYLGLPWVMLDYPRHFDGGNTFAVRTMFWWGHYFSVHLLLQGSYLSLLQLQATVDGVGWYFSTAASPWQHHLDEKEAIPVAAVSDIHCKKQLEHGFYKISCYLPLHHWEQAEEWLQQRLAALPTFINIHADNSATGHDEAQ